MTVATRAWTDPIARYVIENYSRPFETIYDSNSYPSAISQMGQDLLRIVESTPAYQDPLLFLARFPDNLFNLICLDAELLLELDRNTLAHALQQTMRTLAPEGYCAFLIADKFRSGKLIPNGFQLVHRFLAGGFKVGSIWDEKTSTQLSFQLNSHQYLAVFQKPKPARLSIF